MTAAIRRSVAALAALLALVVLFGTTEARAQGCPTVTVVNNTGLAIIFAMYDNVGNALVPSTSLAVGGSTMVPTTRTTTSTPPTTYISIGFVSYPATGFAVGDTVPVSQRVAPGTGPCNTCFHVTLANGQKGPCVIACSSNPCTVTISLAPQCTTCP